MGLWNAVGGHIEDGETPEQSAIREIKEESGITIDKVELQSVFTWNYDDETGYVFTAKLEDGKYDGIIKNDSEGITAFKKIDWIINEKNYGVVEDLKVFINDIKLGVKRNYHMVYKDKTLVEVIVKG
jgi:8-oxo-dGTP diphosphatase